MKIEIQEKKDISDFPKEVQEKIYQLIAQNSDREVTKHVKSSIERGVTDIFPVKYSREKGINPDKYVCDEQLSIGYALHPAKELYLLANDRNGDFEYRFSLEINKEPINLQLFQDIVLIGGEAYSLKRIDESKSGYAFCVSKSYFDGGTGIEIIVIECK